MLPSWQSCSLHLGCDLRTTVAPPLGLAFPPRPLLQLVSTATQGSLGVPSPPLTPKHPCCARTPLLNDYVESSFCGCSLNKTTKDVARRRMIMSPFSSSTPTSTQYIKPTSASQSTIDTNFTFQMSPQPEMALSFPQQLPPPRTGKRCRSVADIDGEHSCIHKKKRRLRLFLITSRLSPQFSHPATNIVDRGNSKIAVWAKQKSLGRHLLRKAAILNGMRRKSYYAKEAGRGPPRVLVEQERAQEELRLATLTFAYGSTDTYTRPNLHRGRPNPPSTACSLKKRHERSSSSPSDSPSPPLHALDVDGTPEYRSPNDAYSYSPSSRSISPRRPHLPSPPSPLGLSNYDAFDLEDNLPDRYAHLDEDSDTGHEYEDDREDAQEDSPLPPATAMTIYPPPNRTCSDGNSKTPPQAVYSDFSMLDPDEPIFSDYDQVEEGANAIWLDAFRTKAQTVPSSSTTPQSSSPDFSAIFAPTPTAVSPSFKPAAPAPIHTAAISLSPNLALSPTASSPNFGPSSSMLRSPNGIGEGATPWAYQPWNMTGRGSENEVEREREGQRTYMFMQFGS
jgi:hypothetical protein